MKAAKPSINPPMGLRPEQVPQFVVLGTDDNATAGLNDNTGIGFLLNLYRGKKNPEGRGNLRTFDGQPIHFSMYGMGEYLWSGAVSPPAEVKRAWRLAVEEGHELGTHTETHPRGRNASLEQWTNEIAICEERIGKPFDEDNLESEHTGIGLSRLELVGFRAPYLEYSNNLFKVLKNRNYSYDCSVEEGYQPGQDAGNHYWPYTLDRGSPADPSIEPVEGLWQIPVYPFYVPDDNECERLGATPGMRKLFDEMESRKETLFNGAYGHAKRGFIRGMDYDMWETYDMTSSQAIAVLKATLDKHLNGNRAPMTICFHSDLYKEDPWARIANTGSGDRKAAVSQFVELALSNDNVRVVSASEMLRWLQDPVPL